MKRLLGFSVLFSAALILSGQAPDKMSYQAVIRNQNGELIVNSIIGFKASIIQGTEEGSVVYSEIQTPETNANGLISIEFGGGDGFGDIDWSTGPYFLKTEIDPSGGLDYSISGISQLLSVPYAYYAEESGTPGPQGESGVGIESIFNNENGTFTFFLTDGSSFTTSDLTGPQGPEGTLPEGDYPGEILYWDGSQWIGIAQGTHGQTLSFCNGVPVWGPCPEDEPGTVTDIDGNIYTTVIIGDQEWMAENLKTTKYRNGTPIDYPGTNNTAWRNNTTGAYGFYNNDILWKDSYGALYNWYAVNNFNGLCPTGWHVPSDAEWNALINYVSQQGYSNQDIINGAGNALKSCRQVNSYLGSECNTTEHPRWDAHTTLFGLDLFGFSALPSGERSYDGTFSSVYAPGNYVAFWSLTEYNQSNSYVREFYEDKGNVNRRFFLKTYGDSVRCIKD